MKPKVIVIFHLVVLVMLSFTVCTDNNKQETLEGTIPPSLIEFELKGDIAAKSFTVLQRVQEGQWINIILKRQSVHGNERFIQLRINCNGSNFIIVKDYAPTLNAMHAQPASTLEQSQNIDVFWGGLAETVCAAN